MQDVEIYCGITTT